MNNGPHAEPPRRRGLQDAIHFRPVCKTNRGAGGVQKKLLHQIPGDLAVVSGQQALQAFDIGELFAGWQYGAGIHRRAMPERERVAVLAHPLYGRPLRR